MSTAERRQNLHSLIDSIADEAVLKDRGSDGDNREDSELRPMTIAEYEVRIGEAEAAIERGEVISHEELEKESESW